MLNCISILAVAAMIIAAGGHSVSAQKKNRRQPVKSAPVARPAETPSEPKAPVSNKKNERPGADKAAVSAKSGRFEAVSDRRPMPYRYEFVQPDFRVAKIVIEHDDAGNGTIAFVKQNSDELISDPLQISRLSLDRIREAYASLDFLNSAEDYQFEKDYSHMGTVTLRMQKNGRERLATFNWTRNEEAKAVADEYRKISNQFVWVFEITVARENQPLEAPQLLSTLDSLIKRKEISDPTQMTPLLRELSDDERIPLIARNHAAKLIKQIEKVKK